MDYLRPLRAQYDAEVNPVKILVAASHAVLDDWGIDFVRALCRRGMWHLAMFGHPPGASDPELTSAEDRNPGQARSRPG